MITRRRFGQLAGGSAAVLAAGRFAAPAIAQAKPKVVVIGGGPGGATAAKYVAKDSNGAIEVTLVEPCGSSSPASTRTSISAASEAGVDDPFLRQAGRRYGVKLDHQMAQAIDRDKKSVRSPTERCWPMIGWCWRPASI